MTASVPGPLLTVDKLEVVYQRAITALEGISLSVARGQIVGILGSNGAGKSTLLRAISGFHGLDDARITDGSIHFEGRPIAHAAPHVSTRAGIVLVPERGKVFPNLTVAENLLVPVAARMGRADQRRREALIYDFFPRLVPLRQRTAGLLSGGERQMLAIAAGLVCQPKLLLVDELSLGLAPVVVADLLQRLLAIRSALSLTLRDRGAERGPHLGRDRPRLCLGKRPHRARRQRCPARRAPRCRRVLPRSIRLRAPPQLSRRQAIPP